MKYCISFALLIGFFILSGSVKMRSVDAASFAGPTIDLEAADDTGISSTDNITNKSILTFDISGSTPGATVELLRNGQPVSSGVAGSVSITLTDAGLSENGTYVYSARETVAGTTGQQGATVDVIFDDVRPLVIVGRASGQLTPTRIEPIRFDIVFSEDVYGFETADVSVGGNIAGLDDATVELEGGNAIFQAVLSDIPADGLIGISVAESVATDAAGNESSFSITYDSLVRLDRSAPNVSIQLANSQLSPTRTLPVRFAISFNEPVTGFSLSDISLEGSTADLSSHSMSLAGSGATYSLSVSGFSSNGESIVVRVPASAATDAAGNASLASTASNAVVVDNVAPKVTVDQAPGQPDPATGFPIRFKVVFSEPVTGFTTDRLWFAGSTVSFANATKSISGSGTTYIVSISDITPANGTLVLSLITGAALDLYGNPSNQSTSVDNIVQLSIESAGVRVSGRVLTPLGTGVRGAEVTITSDSGQSRTVVTSSLGYYMFEDLDPNKGYTISVQSRRYRFSPRSVVVKSSDLAEIDLVGLE